MKKMSKLLSLILSVVMILSTANITALSVSAAETDTKIYFEFPTELWSDAVPANGNLKRLRVYAHTWAVAGDSEYKSASFQSRKEMCTYEGDGIFSYDPGSKLKTPMKEGADYAVIFSTINGSMYQTCSITMGYDCYGDTVVCTGESSENKDNSLLLEWRGVWKNNPNYGPKLEITSTGRVVGEVAPINITKAGVVATFLFDYAENVDNKLVAEVMANKSINVTGKDVYDKYVELYSYALEDPETYPHAPSLETVSKLVGYTKEQIIYFEFPTEFWADAISEGGLEETIVYAHTWAVSEDYWCWYANPSFQSQEEICTYVGDGIFAYNITENLGCSLKTFAEYAVIFSTNGGSKYRTCSITMGVFCCDDTVVCTGERTENVQDAELLDWEGVWKNNRKYGPKLEITSTGKVVGEFLPASISQKELVARFLIDYAVENSDVITYDAVQKIITDERINISAYRVYEECVRIYSNSPQYPEKYPNAPSLEFLAELLDYKNIYVVAGSEELCGVDWCSKPEETPENIMVEVDGVYTKVFTEVYPVDNIELKVVENRPNGQQYWIGDATGYSISFDVVEVCDVTVTYDSSTGEITVTGDGVLFNTDIEIDAMYAVGDSYNDYWLNGVSWDPAAEMNKMSEVAENVYEITFAGVLGISREYEVKFAANGSWTNVWSGEYIKSGEPFDAVYYSNNNETHYFDCIYVDVPYEFADVTLTLDLTNFDYATKTGGKITITVTEPVEDTTTTDPVEDTTTTDPEESTDPVASDVYVVAGSKELCGVLWKGNAEEAPDNVMVEADGVYTKVFTDVQPAKGLQFKVVKNNTYWIGDIADCNIEFNVDEICDVTITFDPATSKITVTGDGVSLILELEINAMHAAGSADDEEDTWLNGVFWDPSAEENKMTEIADRVYTITFEDVKGYSDYYQVKFAANGEWTHNWGGVYTESGKAFDAIYNGDNIVVDVPYEIADVTLTLDLSNFDYATKTGGKITITVVDKTTKELIDGDVNCDGEFNIDDVAYLQMHLAYYKNEDGSALIDTSDIDMFNIADVNGDNNINILDATYMQLMLASLI